ncbi:hypothetical protein [Citrobacter portucalensis]|uniref:hypothetical protein n=1 Tax=Citrobacter portucalensis TaxID=1639133 RepID=UPI001EC40FAB|nr:hypothetical protein [Citrobacter portucalensis]MBJ8679993.1 hypothetical protein [Citrobacter freundii]MCW8353787.1 hypothetical protein [Citrobacter portucalensis]MCX8992732.1 hypothetical protein [Citrobacter portucalensis]MCX9044259.1 hypothetical protein [Citrobacter portucalensis]MCX9053374.1 hypothetical protein [Citrobacter portucalensis]
MLQWWGHLALKRVRKAANALMKMFSASSKVPSSSTRNSFLVTGLSEEELTASHA